MQSQLSNQPNVQIALAGKRFKLVLLALAINSIIGLFLVLPAFQSDVVNYNKITIVWVMSAFIYALACGLYLSCWRRSSILLAFLILFTFPLSVFVSFPYILYKAYSHSWHQQ